MNQITPRTLKGFRDLLPADAILRQRVINTIIEVYESFGFAPLETPALEYAEVLTGKYGDEGEKLMYRFQDQGGREVALRYDLTVPLARVVAQYQDLPKPFRRYQISPVWRAENTQKGRFREFTQCDIDIAGSESLVADAEIAQVIAAVLEKLKVGKYQVRINNRKVLNGMLEVAGIPEDKLMGTLRALDKWTKVGADGVKVELSAQLTDEQITALFAILPKEGESFFAWGSRNGATLIKSPVGKEGWIELNKVMELLQSSGQNPEVFVGDVLLARGLDYYTGTIFEAVLTDAPEFGSVFGGGRYDKLIGMFAGKDIPAVGASAGVDRIMAAMTELGLADGKSSTATVLVTQMDAALQNDYIQIASELRANGINTELFCELTKLDKQLKYADKAKIPLVVIVGTNEKEKGEATVKVLATKQQQTVSRDKLASTIKGMAK